MSLCCYLRLFITKTQTKTQQPINTETLITQRRGKNTGTHTYGAQHQKKVRMIWVSGYKKKGGNFFCRLLFPLLFYAFKNYFIDKKKHRFLFADIWESTFLPLFWIYYSFLSFFLLVSNNLFFLPRAVYQIVIGKSDVGKKEVFCNEFFFVNHWYFLHPLTN